MTGWRDMVESADHGSHSDPKVETVTALTRRVKHLLEGQIGEIWVQGEVSNLRRQASGHSYFVLKDGGAQISCVLFRGNAARQSVKLSDGQQVILGGRIGVYEVRGQYQLIVESIKEDGVGRLRREFERLKHQLADEGLFDPERKRPLPALPLRLAIVTSPTGAAVQDFVRILLRRNWRGTATVVPVRVQGQEAAEEIAEGIEWANQTGTYDVVVVARGGGSLEDLWAFNEERVVRAVSDSALPVVSAIGHEIDFSLCDFAADVRAETPSGAAELLSSSYGEMTDRLQWTKDRLQQVTLQIIQDQRRSWSGLKDRLRLLTPRSLLEQGWQRRDELSDRLHSGLHGCLRHARQQLRTSKVAWRSADPHRRIEQDSQKLLSLWKRLQSVSPQATLRRGFTMVRNEKGKPVTKLAEMDRSALHEIEFYDGRQRVRPDSES